MSPTIQRATIVLFISTTIIFTAFIAYTAQVYLIVFRGVRVFSVTTPQLYIRIVNSSYISTTTNVTIQNPSEITMELRLVRETLSLDGEFILVKTVSVPGFLQIEPDSTTTLAIKADIPSHKVSHVDTHIDGAWFIYIRLHLNAPLVDGFSWANSWFITEPSKVQMNAYESHNETSR
jgi:hypothetical protein